LPPRSRYFPHPALGNLAFAVISREHQVAWTHGRDHFFKSHSKSPRTLDISEHIHHHDHFKLTRNRIASQVPAAERNAGLAVAAAPRAFQCNVREVDRQQRIASRCQHLGEDSFGASDLNRRSEALAGTNRVEQPQRHAMARALIGVGSVFPRISSGLVLVIENLSFLKRVPRRLQQSDESRVILKPHADISRHRAHRRIEPANQG
jgi:hypothetical protein